MTTTKSFDRYVREDFSQHLRTWNETKSLMSMTPLKNRKQQILTPAQQLEMRDEIQKCKSLGEVIRVVDRYIIDKDHDGELDEVAVTPGRFYLRLIRILSMVMNHSYPVRNMSGMARGGVYSRSLPPPRALFLVASIAPLRQRPKRRKPVHQSNHSTSQIGMRGTLERIL